MPRTILFLLVGVGFAGVAEAQEQRPLRERHDFSRPSAIHRLPGRLEEISGLAFAPDGRLFAHDDERAWIHEIDPATGEVGKRFMLGKKTVQDDFEGMAIVGERFFLITSAGLLYESREGGDREEMEYRVTDIGLSGICEIEGIDYHPGWDELLIPCKGMRQDVAFFEVHRIPMSPDAPRPPPIRVQHDDLAAFGVDMDFKASAIALDPSTGTLVLVAGPEEAILEISTEGRVLSALTFPRGWHAQAEGVEFGPDGTLYVSDEKNGRDARLTAYVRIAGSGL